MSLSFVKKQENLHISTEKLEVLNKSYLDLIGFVSHELKGMLASIILNTYLIRKGILGSINEKQKKTLNSITRNLNYLSVTVKNFLNLSRIEKNELEINKNDILLNKHVFSSALESFEQQIEEKNMKVENLIDEELVVWADASLLQIAVNNLINNAVKYGYKDGFIKIKSFKSGNYTEIEIYNDGQPIQETDMDKLFKKFSRIIYRGMEDTKGSGIGLYITKEIIKLHGGNIKVVSGKTGNSFIFTIENK
jgi:signal transduction histidine kinase